MMWIWASTTQDLADVFQHGVKPNGVSQDQDVILVQTSPFYYGECYYYQICARISEDQIFVDIDEPDAEFTKLPNEKDYLRIPISELSWKDKSDVGYGLFVKEIPLKQIRCIELVVAIATGIVSTTQIYPLPGSADELFAVTQRFQI